ncbi:WecB/TagA/CpsF family glycosyltransferase [Rhodococcus sp. JS3073]|uniref:WecB/TagA/CpsF family glycosyltransferase n=1 Tax=Rhodococcus sp. JS3073 TaxID=3002901 RepID=UPI002286999D|nr:WecB/TagA/CpsF family glycosyltransferase [Rhodococcus sp. JS3073]WAM16832.1 WecB/TagA/CpsF family glycosyltransferase [Rhodococcus sp. JS3073]
MSTLPNAVRRVIRAARESEAISVRLSNAYCVALAFEDRSYGGLLNGPGLNFPDGTPVVWFMRKRASATQSPGRVRGPSLFKETINAGREHNVAHFFLGTTPATLESLTAAMKREFNGVNIAGTYSPPFGPIDDDFYNECVARIEETDSQIIWVALGTPKQDFVAEELAKRIKRPCVAVGAAFDFAAGTAREAPKWVQDSGIEWLYRLATEPKRLWRRYLFGNVLFLRAALLKSGQ